MKTINVHEVFTRVINHYMSRLVAHYTEDVSKIVAYERVIFGGLYEIIRSLKGIHPLIDELMIVRERMWRDSVGKEEKTEVSLKTFESAMNHLMHFIEKVRWSKWIEEGDREYWLREMRKMLEDISKFIHHHCFEEESTQPVTFKLKMKTNLGEKIPYILLKIYLEEECAGYYLTDEKGELDVKFPRGEHTVTSYLIQQVPEVKPVKKVMPRVKVEPKMEPVPPRIPPSEAFKPRKISHLKIGLAITLFTALILALALHEYVLDFLRRFLIPFLSHLFSFPSQPLEVYLFL